MKSKLTYSVHDASKVCIKGHGPYFIATMFYKDGIVDTADGKTQKEAEENLLKDWVPVCIDEENPFRR